MLRGAIAFIIILVAACAAESITMPKDELPPVITLVQEEPVYHENTEHVGQENEVNVEKFSNPTFCSGDEQTTTNNKEEGTSSAVVSTTESEPLNRETVTSSSLHDHTTTHTDGLPVERLTKSGGVFMGPSGRETWYNLNMSVCVKMMRDKGFSEEEYPVWTREDGAKMFGDFVMCAANIEIRPKGTIIETSLGLAICVDTGSFCQSDKTAVDICVNW